MSYLNILRVWKDKEYLLRRSMILGVALSVVMLGSLGAPAKGYAQADNGIAGSICMPTARRLWILITPRRQRSGIPRKVHVG